MTGYRQAARFAIALLISAAIVVLSAPTNGLAEEAFGKWRIELHVGGVDPGDSIRSDAANEAFIERPPPQGGFLTFPDARDDNLASNEARISTDLFLEFRIGYGIHRWKRGEVILDVGVSNWDQNIDDVEYSYLYESALLTDPIPTPEGRFIDAASMSITAVSVDVLLRYQPTRRFNPYIGVGVGYMFVDLDDSEEWAQLANQLDNSFVTTLGPGDTIEPVLSDPRDTITIFREFGTSQFDFLYEELESDRIGDDFFPACNDLGFNRPNPAFDPDPDPGDPPQDPTLRPPRIGIPCGYATFHDLDRPQIDAPDTPFIQLRGGAEWQVSPRWAVFGEVRFSWASKGITITADGDEKFGPPVPQGTFPSGALPTSTVGSAAVIGLGGEVATTVGSPQPTEIVVCQSPDAEGACLSDRSLWAADTIPGGATRAQPGAYWINGGELDYGGFTFTVGARFTL